MAQDHVGQIVLIIGGAPFISVRQFRESVTTNNELVMGMTPSGLPAGKSRGTKEFTVSVDAYIPESGEPDWENIENGALATIPRDGVGPTVIYTGLFAKSVQSTYQERGAAIRTIEFGVLRKAGA